MLEKLKDIFYDKNDIIVAFAILAVAGFIITRQIDSIITYPEQLAAEMRQQQEQQELQQQEQQEPLDQPDSQQGQPDEQQQDGQQPEQTAPQGSDSQNSVNPPQTDPQPQTDPTEFKTAVDRTVEIPAGAYSASIASILSSAGVIPSQQEFLSAVTAANAETKLRAGSFYIPAGSTLNDVVHILTN